MKKVLIVLALLVLPTLCFASSDSDDDFSLVSIASPVQIADASGDILKLDPATGAVSVIDYGHHEIHSGSHFKAGTQDLDLDTNQTLAYCLTTSNTAVWAHYVMTAQATGAATVQLFENPTITGYGAEITIQNRNRNLTTSESVMTMGLVTNHSSTGTTLATKWIGGSGFKTEIAGEHRGDSEFILDQDEQYMVMITSTGDNNKVAIGADWYEHEDIN